MELYASRTGWFILKLTQTFYFDAAHTLNRAVNVYDHLKSKNIHGHTYHASISVEGEPNENGMVRDFGDIKHAVDAIRYALDHELLDNVPELGIPTLENLCLFIAKRLKSIGVTEVSVERKASGDKCTYLIKEKNDCYM
jgi:6-pyruvoyltetrahydropterin/6-carboxytetrahydropterin synthase